MLRILTDGTRKADGGGLYGPVPKMDWENMVVTDRRNRITLGLNCLLVDTPEGWVLINTGVGPDAKRDGKYSDMHGLVPSRLLKQLKVVGVTPKEIGMVILTDLQAINAGGSVHADRVGNIVPTFRRARYIVQRAALGEAFGESCKAPSERSEWHPNPAKIFTPLLERGQLEIIDGDREIIPGINVRKTNGFSRGHQIVLIRDKSEHAAYLGSVVPTLLHLNPICISAFARHRELAEREKQEILAEAVAGRWLVVLPWEARTPAGYIQEVRGDPEDSRTFRRFVPVDLSPRPADRLVQMGVNGH